MTLPTALQAPLLFLGCILLLSACQQSSGPKDQAETQASSSAEQQEANPLLLFVGTYTEQESPEGKSEGIYVYEMNPSTGELTLQSTASGIKNPSFLAVHPNGQYLYAVSEIAGNDTIEGGLVYAYRFDPATRQLQQINAVSSHGSAPCYISIDATGRFVAIANYGGGNVALYPIGEDGALQAASSVIQHEGKGPTQRQEHPHAHMIIPGPQNNYFYAVDLGIDQVLLYALDANSGTLRQTNNNTKVTPGAGPRHLTFHPDQDWAYLVNELNGTVIACRRDAASGALTPFQTISTLPEGSQDGACADIHVTPSGQYLYATNRGAHNSIAMYSIDQTSGELKLIGHQSTQGETPRNFAIDPSGKFLLVANQNTGNIVTFSLDSASGKLTDTGIETKVPKPVCIQFL